MADHNEDLEELKRIIEGHTHLLNMKGQVLSNVADNSRFLAPLLLGASASHPDIDLSRCQLWLKSQAGEGARRYGGSLLSGVGIKTCSVLVPAKGYEVSNEETFRKTNPDTKVYISPQIEIDPAQPRKIVHYFIVELNDAVQPYGTHRNREGELCLSSNADETSLEKMQVRIVPGSQIMPGVIKYSLNAYAIPGTHPYVFPRGHEFWTDHPSHEWALEVAEAQDAEQGFIRAEYFAGLKEKSMLQKIIDEAIHGPPPSRELAQNNDPLAIKRPREAPFATGKKDLPAEVQIFLKNKKDGEGFDPSGP